MSCSIFMKFGTDFSICTKFQHQLLSGQGQSLIIGQNRRTENLPLKLTVTRLSFKISSPNLAIRQKYFPHEICLRQNSRWRAAACWWFHSLGAFYAPQHAIARIHVYARPIPPVRLSVCPSVCPSHASIASKRLNVSSKFFHCPIGPSF